MTTTVKGAGREGGQKLPKNRRRKMDSEQHVFHSFAFLHKRRDITNYWIVHHIDSIYLERPNNTEQNGYSR
jgi:hypothetical protein